MQLFVLLALCSLAAAQCSNSCNCGNSACCQNSYSSASPYSIFNIGNSQQYSQSSQYGYGNAQQYRQSSQYGYGQQYGNAQQCSHCSQYSYGQRYGNAQQYSHSSQYGYGQQYGNAQQCSHCSQYGYRQQYGNAQQQRYGYGGNYKRNLCLEVNPISYSLTQTYQNQPVFTRVIPYNDNNQQIDSICTTLFPLPDDSHTYVIYDSVVYCDGSNSMTTTIANDIDSGTYFRGNSIYSIAQRNFASLGNNIFMTCSRDLYEDGNGHGISVTSIGNISPLGPSCIQQIQNILECTGLDQQCGLYVLPYRLPTRCVTQQVCSITNPLLFPNLNYPYGSSGYNCGTGPC